MNACPVPGSRLNMGGSDSTAPASRPGRARASSAAIRAPPEEPTSTGRASSSASIRAAASAAWVATDSGSVPRLLRVWPRRS